MGTLSDYSSADSVARSRRGTFNSVGASPVPDTKATTPRPSVAAQLGQKVTDVAKQSADIGKTIAVKSASYVKNVGVDIYQAARGAAQTYADAQTQPAQQHLTNKLLDQLDAHSAKLTADYKAGKVSKDNYQKELDSISKAYTDIGKSLGNVINGPSPTQRAKDVVETGVNILSVGELSLAAVGGKQVAEAGGKDAIKVLMDEGASSLEKAVLKFPVVRDLVERNLEGAASRAMSENLNQFIFREGRHIAAGLLVKRPIFYQANVGLAEDSLKNIVKGNYSAAAKDAGWLGIQMIKGGPLGGAAYLFGLGKTATGKLAYGKGSLIDELSSRIGDGNRTQIADLLTTIKTRSPEKYKEYEDALKVMQESSNRVYGADVSAAADNLMATFEGRDVSTITARDWINTQLDWHKAYKAGHEALQQLVSEGKMTAEQAARYTPVRWDAGMRDATARAVRTAGINPDDQWLAVQNYGESMGFANNQNLMNRLKYEIYNNAGGTGDIEIAIKSIDATSVVAKGLPDKVWTKISKLGYVMGEPAGGPAHGYLESEGLPKLISAATKGEVDVFDAAIAPQPQVQAIAGFIKAIGLSSEATTRLANQELTKNVVAGLDNHMNVGHEFGIVKENGDVVSGGQAVLTTLQNYIENKKANSFGKILTLGTNDKSAITDLRQLTKKNIIEALSTDKYKLTTQDAKGILKAINKAYYEVPMSLRGAGDHFVDWLYKINPGHKYYSRIQSAFRYTYNPFFRVQEETETFLGSALTGGNRVKAHLLFNTSKEELNNVVKTLDDARIFTSSFYGEGAQDVVLGRITANITQGQKRDLAGLAMDIANKKGLTVEQMVADHPDEINDALRVIVQYPQKGFLASPMSRTLNLAFFPMRYNLKVTAVAAGVLAKEPPVMQTAIIHSLFKMDEWLKSDEGIRWQSQHADAIQVFNWITPINSIEYTLGLLNGTNSIGDLGNLGGLPIGIISQVLDSMGVIHLNTPYVNPKTGDVIPKYIPQSTKAQAAVALGDLLGTMFTYPGRTLGLPGKQQTINKVVDKFIDTNSSEFTKQDQTDRLTPLQQNWVRVLKGDTSEEAVDALYNSPTPGGFNYYTLPPLATPQPIVTPRSGLPTKASKKKKRVKPVAQPIH